LNLASHNLHLQPQPATQLQQPSHSSSIPQLPHSFLILPFLLPSPAPPNPPAVCAPPLPTKFPHPPTPSPSTPRCPRRQPRWWWSTCNKTVCTNFRPKHLLEWCFNRRPLTQERKDESCFWLETITQSARPAGTWRSKGMTFRPCERSSLGSSDCSPGSGKRGFRSFTRAKVQNSLFIHFQAPNPLAIWYPHPSRSPTKFQNHRY